MEDISVLILELPENVKAVTVIVEGKYSVILNSIYNEEAREEILEEELRKVRKQNENG